MILLRKKGSALWPTDEESETAINKLPDGAEVAVESKRARSPEQHRFLFKMLQIAFENQQTDFRSVDEMRKALLIAAGYTEPQKRLNGEIVNVARSMSYHSMKAEEFNELVDKFLDLICTVIMPGMDRETLERESR